MTGKHQPNCECGVCKHKLGCKCPFHSQHKNSCPCPRCTGVGSLGHNEDCKCPFCSGDGSHGHKSNCPCSFCLRLGANGHEIGCQCSYCGTTVHRDDCTCPWCLGQHPGNKETGIEVAMQELLTKLGIIFKAQKRIGRYRVDIYVPSRGLVIECDGEYWHRFEDSTKRRRRDRFIRNQGLRLWHFTEAEINAGCEQRLRRALRH